MLLGAFYRGYFMTGHRRTWTDDRSLPVNGTGRPTFEPNHHASAGGTAR